ncbi:MAG: iron-containing alcohol dehydrogenase [Phoenicibacter congonensis]|uniref:Iron-containing alcohol dehydrogenase n=1 Tax=Phoenicibacter congonensis TaxID=1944646 RepID=A0AA43RH96_9ACTN|nr:iron-containing alcohol dehydrogenase [Phoenicibacter congonensis]
MLGNFVYENPTKIIFGKDSMAALSEELKKYGDKVQLIYGGGSIKKNGIYEQVLKALSDAGKTVVEDAGVMPNPTIEKLRDGIQIARDNDVDFLLAVGGGSCVDCAKAVAISVHCDEDPWQKYFVDFEEPDCEILPVGSVLTMVGTGSEMNGGSVISNHETAIKSGHVFGVDVFPKFAVMNPEFTYSVPQYQMVAGIYDIMNHIMEQYFSGDDDCASDYIMEGLMRSVINSARVAVADPKNYEARSNLMWDATWALNTFVSKGKPTDWEIHMLGQAISAHTDATHGMTLAAVTLPYYKHIMRFGVDKFVRFARNVWDVRLNHATDEEVALAGLQKLEEWMREIGLVMNITELGCDESMLEALADSTFVMTGGYHPLSREEIIEIFRASL